MLFDFTKNLIETGLVKIEVVPTPMVDTEERNRVFSLLVDFEYSYRHFLPANPPTFAADVAVWAAEQFFLATHFLVARDTPDDEVAKLFEDNFRSIAKPVVDPVLIYSVDLVFRFLPDLLRIGSMRGGPDPLYAELYAWARLFPFSSVAAKMTNGSEINNWNSIEPIMNHQCLSRMYIDRIVAADAVHRLADESARQRLHQDVGEYPELIGRLSKHLGDSSPQSSLDQSSSSN